MMNVFVNNREESIGENATIQDFLKSQGLSTKRGIAIAVNNFVIAKATWGETQLKEKDKITIIQATQGG